MPNEISIENPKNIGLQLLALTACVLGGLFVGQFFSLLFLVFAYNFQIDRVQELLLSPSFNAEGRFVLLSLQAITSFCMFMLAPWFYLKVAERQTLATLNNKPCYATLLFIYAIIIPLLLMPLIAFLADWNEAIKLPTFLSDFEVWASQKEQELKKITIFLTDFANWQAFLVGVVIIAVIPAMGEELLFRGFLQRKLSHRLSPHVAILLSSFIFSAIHLQFYGFFPRMFLGILLGYLYFWSGNLWYAIVAHFINNATTLSLIYLYKLQWISMDINSPKNITGYSILGSILVAGLAIGHFQAYSQKRHSLS